MKSSDLLYNMMTMVDNTVLNNCNLLRENNLNVPTEMIIIITQICEVMDVLLN